MPRFVNNINNNKLQSILTVLLLEKQCKPNTREVLPDAFTYLQCMLLDWFKFIRIFCHICLLMSSFLCFLFLSGWDGGDDPRPHQRHPYDPQHLQVLQHLRENDLPLCQGKPFGHTSLLISAVVCRLFRKPVNLLQKTVGYRLTFRPIFLINTCHSAWIRPPMCAHVMFMS